MKTTMIEARFKKFRGETIAHIRKVDGRTVFPWGSVAFCYAHDGGHFEMSREDITKAPTASPEEAEAVKTEMQIHYNYIFAN